jgi:hypothetical protein
MLDITIRCTLLHIVVHIWPDFLILTFGFSPFLLLFVAFVQPLLCCILARADIEKFTRLKDSQVGSAASTEAAKRKQQTWHV